MLLNKHPIQCALFLYELALRGDRGLSSYRAYMPDFPVKWLGGRIFDMNCGWPMYRIPYGVARWVVQHGAELGRFLEQARALESRL